MRTKKEIRPAVLLIRLLEGIVVGFGAILPGISGGTLCVAFGMYRPIIETLSDFKTGLKKYGLTLLAFAAGIGAGFVGLSGLAAYLMERNTELVTCAFIGFILGTVPELWKDAGSQGRTRGSVISMLAAFAAMLAVLFLLKTKLSLQISEGIPAYLLCGLLWGFSFIIPGLSSSSLLLFFGLYQPMLKGIADFDFSVLIPMGIGLAACVLLLSKAVGALFKNHHSLVSHAVLGIVAATAIMILPEWKGLSLFLLNLIAIIAGAAASFGFTCLCARLGGINKEKQ